MAVSGTGTIDIEITMIAMIMMIVRTGTIIIGIAITGSLIMTTVIEVMTGVFQVTLPHSIGMTMGTTFDSRTTTMINLFVLFSITLPHLSNNKSP